MQWFLGILRLWLSICYELEPKTTVVVPNTSYIENVNHYDYDCDCSFNY